MKYATIKYHDIANGVGVRTSLFVSGCTHACEGCFNRVAWDFHYGQDFSAQTISDIVQSLEPGYISGLSLLGGEPLEVINQRSIIHLVREVKRLYPQKTIWCYTGFTYDVDLVKGGRAYCEVTNEILKCIDVLVDGKFIQSLYDISLRFRGSSNQRLIDVPKSRACGEVILWDETRF